MSTTDRPFALRLYQDGEGSSSLLCRLPRHECPQWWYESEHRYTFPTPEEALAFLGVIHSEWPEFKSHDVRVVRVIPPQRETYEEVTSFGCPEPR
jgi:hypothetical protein